MSFDLTVRPWIPVVDLTGAHQEWGLEEALARAHEARRVVGDSPTTTAALHRLVLAFAHRVYGPRSLDRWQEYWEKRAVGLPRDPLVDYLLEHREKFDLFHPHRPFFQCPALRECPPATAAKLVPYRSVGSNVTLFDKTLATDRPTLAPAEAARWLVTLQAYDPGGLKTPAPGGKDKSSERAPANHFGCVLVEGATLLETLLLNLLIYDADRSHTSVSLRPDRPVWEDEEPVSPEPDKRSPLGLTDLLTWPSRRVLLTADPGTDWAVTGVVITPGVRLEADLPSVEGMAAYRRPPRRGKKELLPKFPVRLEPLRGVWRHAEELLLANTDAKMGAADRYGERQRPAALDQIASLVDRDHLRDDAVYTLRVFGQQLDKKGAVAECWLEEAVPAPVALMRQNNRSLGCILGCASRLADEAGALLRALQRDYRKSFRAPPAGDLDVRYWPRLVRPFDDFVRHLGEAARRVRPIGEVIGEWRDVVCITATGAAETWIYGQSRASERDLLSAGEYLARFRKDLYLARLRYEDEADSYVPEELWDEN
ncbi:type I-E CRISPR-associated protein Cse1/CasA [Actinoalloteichus caeruleus]|uniref:type I-E CRISPR-associated protein Cse1/CasA n=1 Tax=Actinoalloteichus cyanogriseus TaxID=2893586 RepID=UPI003AAD9DE6